MGLFSLLSTLSTLGLVFLDAWTPSSWGLAEKGAKSLIGSVAKYFALDPSTLLSSIGLLKYVGLSSWAALFFRFHWLIIGAYLLLTRGGEMFTTLTSILPAIQQKGLIGGIIANTPQIATLLFNTFLVARSVSSTFPDKLQQAVKQAKHVLK